MTVCSACGTRPVLVKKRGLCGVCYQRARRLDPAAFRPDHDAITERKIAAIETAKARRDKVRERDMGVARLIAEGLTLQEVADMQGLSRQRVHQLITRVGAKVYGLRPRKVRTFRCTSPYRAVFLLRRGEIPDGMTIDHICFNPMCCNPAHLQLLTLSENSARKNPARRSPSKREHCKNGHPISVTSGGNRYCKVCEHARHAKYRANARPEGCQE